MRALFLSVALILNVILAAPVAAKEPANLAVAKATVRHYHDSGEYMRDFNQVAEQALQYLEHYVKHMPADKKKTAIILDIDDTSLSNYADLNRYNFGGTREDTIRNEDKGEDPALAPVLKLYRYAREHNIAVIFITGRFEEQMPSTIRNLKQVGYDHWERLICRHGQYRKAPAAVYKTAERKQLSEQGYDIILNIGDQDSDLRGGYAQRTFKLPNPFYLIP